MADRHDYVALEWVKGEIETTLSLARQALESYVEDAQDSTQLGFCFNYLHQVNGTLQMVEFYGAALLSEELEKLAKKLVDQDVEATHENLSILMQGILQLPNYLDKVKEYQQDLPIVLLPIINEIRTACQEDMMSAGVLFQPDLTKAQQKFAAVANAYKQTQFSGLSKKLHQMYQVALLGLLKNQDIEKNLAYLEKVMTHLNKHCDKTPLSIYWKISSGLIAGLQEKSIELSAATKEILKDIDKSIKAVTQDAQSALGQYIDEDQLKNLLFYIAKAKSQNPIIQAIKDDYKLAEALPNIDGYTNENAMSGPDKDAMTSVIIAITEETAKIKEQVEALTNQDATQEDLVTTKDSIKLIGDTMAALGFTELRKVLLDQYKVLELAEQNNQMLNEAQLMEMASSILFVESSLQGGSSFSDGAPQSKLDGVSDAHNAVIREARNGLEQAKDAIVDYIGSQWDIEKIAEVPQTLKSIAGGLKMIPLHKASNIIDACEQYFTKKLIEEQLVPQWDQLDQLADALMGIEYFLERLTQDGRGSNTSLLNAAQKSIEALGMRVAADDEVVKIKEPKTLVETTEVLDVIEEKVELLISPISSITKTEKTVEIETKSEDEDDLIDDEIIEIFVEEATEVLEVINEFLPKYKQDPKDKESLTEFRRAYHTLKGSGRMVGANDLAELAWSIESLLNKHIESIVDYSPALFQIIEDVTQYMPTLVKQFENRESVDLEKIALLTDQANLIATGEKDKLRIVSNDNDVNVLEEQPSLEVQNNDQEVELEEEYDIGIDFGLEESSNETDSIELTLQEDDSSEDPTETELPALEEDAGGSLELTLVEDETTEVAELTLLDEDNSDIPELSLVDDEITDVPELTLMDEDNSDIPELSILSDEVTQDPVITDAMLGINDDKRNKKIKSEDPEFVEFEVDEGSLDSLFGGDFSEDSETEAQTPALVEIENTEDDDDQIYVIFAEELASHLTTVKTYLEAGPNTELSEELQRALHTIKGAAHMAGVMQLAEAISPVEKLIQTMHQLNVKSDDEILEVLRQTVERCEHTLTDVVQFLESNESSQGFAKYVHEIMSRLVGAQSNPEGQDEENPLQTFLSATMDIIIDSEEVTGSWDLLHIEQDQIKQLHDNMQQLTEFSKTAFQPVFESLSIKLAEMYQMCMDDSQNINNQFIEIAKEAQDALVNLMDRLAAAQTLEIQIDIEDRIALFLSEELKVLSDEQIDLEAEADDNEIEFAIDQSYEGDTAGIEFTIESSDSEEKTITTATNKKSFVVSADDDLVEIFVEEATELVENIRQLLIQWEENTNDLTLVENLQRDLHTIKGGARMAQISPLGDLSHELEFLYEGLFDGRYQSDDSIFELLYLCQHEISDMVQDIETQGQFDYDPTLIDKIKDYCSSHKAGYEIQELSNNDEPTEDIELAIIEEPELVLNESGIIIDDTELFEVNTDPDLIEIFLEEAEEILESIQVQFETWKKDISNHEPVHILQRDLHTLKGGARMAEISPIGDLGHELEFLYEGIVNQKYIADESLIELIENCNNSLADMVSDIQETMFCKNDRFLFECVQNYCAGNGFNLSAYDQVSDDPDKDNSLIGIFVEETQTLLGQLIQARLAWRYSPKDTEQSDVIKRVLHTIKGGANLAEKISLANNAEALELFVINSDTQTKNETFFDQLDEKLDQLDVEATIIINEYLNVDSNESNSEEVGSQIDDWISGETNDTISTLSLEDSIESDIVEPKNVEPKIVESKEGANYDNAIEFDSSVLSNLKLALEPKTAMDIADDAKRLAGEQEASDKKRRGQNQETVKVAANVLDGLVNLAGETSISRARLEQEMADFNFTLSEMHNAIDRMNEQIRRLDNETQEQVAYRQEQAEEELEEFDPLEMDRYSSIQQLSRSIMESASDLADLQDTLKERTRDTETILLQQSRINTELQEGLMQTRMVPFSGIAPRLRRIIRQTSSELNKKAELEFFNIEGEVDRTVLERMVAPLEHMLRNSIDHGIEMPNIREKAGKPKTGKIELSLAREGSYMVLTLRDDGAGIDISRIRAKAVEKGLMNEDSNLTDQEILMFILDAGFSTAEKITQISGRGVGMDVVHSEVKQLGGVMNIDSTVGKGSLFTIRIPVTVSLSRALMVSIQDDIYALPLNSIEGIVRVSPAQMQQFYQPGAPKFRYSGKDYRVQYLGSLMDENVPAHIPSDAAAIPLILVHGVDNDHTLALHVDQLLGSREIVVKTIGPQFTSVTGLTGATILGDGSVVVILDLPSMIRSVLASDHHQTTGLQIGTPVREVTEDRAKVVMVVDDSVTVRKVTSRLLERNGYEVILAKDGQDAITQLQDVVPDIMLLDIEMPRMDGFEVATRVRHNPAISDLPIIMITSRTGEKHKERALSIGVNEYLGKPFQEGPLLETIKEQLDMVKA
ncbi:MAG: Hpt domain-containing protein [Saccharospirillaceae bacterium]|nr:Hpt domain-containing protein [Saccharospirillaceae bacterium]